VSAWSSSSRSFHGPLRDADGVGRVEVRVGSGHVRVDLVAAFVDLRLDVPRLGTRVSFI